MHGYAARGAARIGLVFLLGSTSAWTEPRFVETGRLAGVEAEWLALDGDRLILGAGNRVELALAAPRPEGRGRIERSGRASTGVIAGSFVFLAGSGGRIERFRLDRPWDEGRVIGFDPSLAEEILLARAGDYLVVVEQDRAMSLHEIAVHVHHGAEHREPGDLIARGVLPLRGRSVAAAASGATLYLAFEGGRVALVDVSDPRRPTLAGEIDLGTEIRALAASGTTLFVLDGMSLRVFDTEHGATRVTHESALPGGRALEVAGRSLYVATDDGLIALRDASAGEATFNVTVSTSLFTPSLLTIDPGDTVTWTKAVTAVSHNVRACSGEPNTTCGGGEANESFTSGTPTTAAFSLSHTFQLSGENPYFCAIHELGGMRGRVTVRDVAPVVPPGVHAGPPGVPMTVQKNDAAGNSLTLRYDVTTCTGAADHHIVVGGETTFPAVPGGVLGLLGGSCNIGTASPFVWNPSPPTTIDAEGLIWWLIVADDNATVEGSWGKNSASNERIGPGAGGSSGLCGITAKDLTNTCGQ